VQLIEDASLSSYLSTPNKIDFSLFKSSLIRICYWFWVILGDVWVFNDLFLLVLGYLLEKFGDLKKAFY
jgi:hypothetical protein